VTGLALATIDRRLDASPRGSGAHVYSAAYFATFAVDPFFSDVEEVGQALFCYVPMLDEEHVQAAESIVERVGCKTAITQFTCLVTQGYPKRFRVWLRAWLSNVDRMKGGLFCWAAGAPASRHWQLQTASQCGVNLRTACESCKQWLCSFCLHM
jgi:hypothetical protein